MHFKYFFLFLVNTLENISDENDGTDFRSGSLMDDDEYNKSRSTAFGRSSLTQTTSGLSLNSGTHCQNFENERVQVQQEAAYNNDTFRANEADNQIQEGDAVDANELNYQTQEYDAAGANKLNGQMQQDDEFNTNNGPTNNDFWVPEDDNEEDYEFDIHRQVRLHREAEAEAANLDRRLLAPRDEIRNRVRKPCKKNQIEELKAKQLDLLKVQMDAQKLFLQNAKSVEAVNRGKVVIIKILQKRSREKLKLAEYQRKIAELEYKQKKNLK